MTLSLLRSFPPLFALLGLVLSGCDNGQIDDTSPEGDDDTIIDNDDDDAVADDDVADDDSDGMGTVRITSPLSGVSVLLTPTDESRTVQQCTTVCPDMSVPAGNYVVSATLNEYTSFCNATINVSAGQLTEHYLIGGQAPEGEYDVYANAAMTGDPLWTYEASTVCEDGELIAKFEHEDSNMQFSIDGQTGEYADQDIQANATITATNSVVTAVLSTGSTFYFKQK